MDETRAEQRLRRMTERHAGWAQLQGHCTETLMLGTDAEKDLAPQSAAVAAGDALDATAADIGREALALLRDVTSSTDDWMRQRAALLQRAEAM